MKFKIVLLGLIICTQIQAQNSERRIMGKEYAEKHLMLALKNNADRTKMNEKLILKEANAIKYAELILFEKYKKDNIEFQKPYQVYLIDDYWVIYGTLPKNYKGGVFSIVFDSWNGKILRLTHGK